MNTFNETPLYSNNRSNHTMSMDQKPKSPRLKTSEEIGKFQNVGYSRTLNTEKSIEDKRVQNNYKDSYKDKGRKNSHSIPKNYEEVNIRASIENVNSKYKKSIAATDKSELSNVLGDSNIKERDIFLTNNNIDLSKKEPSVDNNNKESIR